MSDTISKEVLVSSLPPGPIWQPKTGGDFDLLLDGIADGTETVRIFIDSLSDVRDPLLTLLLGDLEKEFGIPFDPSLTEDERRAQLLSIKTANNGDGTATFLQSKLTQAGFDLQVHVNDPPADPGLILGATYNTYHLGTDAFHGNPLATHGGRGGFLLVNGFEVVETYPIPSDPDTWPLIFFVGGDAVRNGSTDVLESIVPGVVAMSRQSELERLIVKIKPLHSWCGLMVDFVA